MIWNSKCASRYGLKVREGFEHHVTKNSAKKKYTD